MSWLQSVLLVNIVLQVALFLISVKKLKVKKYYRKTVHWIFPFGAYVWEDMLVLSIFWIISSSFLFLLSSWKLTLILLLIFFTVRWFGEMLYWFLQQFHSDNFRPNDFGFRNLPNQNIYIIYQVMHICQVTLALFALYWAINFLPAF